MWAQAGNALLGVWLMIAPAVLGYGGAGAVDHRIVGPLAAATGMVAAWGATRRLGRLNVVFGASLIVTPWLAGFAAGASWNSVAAGWALALLALVDGDPRRRFDGGWAVLLRRTPRRSVPPSRQPASQRDSAA